METRIPGILEREWCEKHEAPQGRPCWYITTSLGKRLGAICNKRAKKAGFKRPPNPNSLKKK